MSEKSDGKFKPGQSGNPSGRPKLLVEVQKLTREHGLEAVQKLVELMRNCPDPKIQMHAAKELLDRGFGKAAQIVEVSSNEGLNIQFVDGPPQDKSYEAWLQRKRAELDVLK